MRWTSMWAAVSLAVAACQPGASPPTVEPDPTVASADREVRRAAPGAEVLQRVSVIGASQSAGFGDGIALHRVLRVALGDGSTVFDASSSAHFVDAEAVGDVQVLAARLREPTVVIAVDFLFWYAHGIKSPIEREESLASGLAKLDTLPCPILVGDLPDVSAASRRMISPEQLPTPSERAKLNQQIRAWARERPRVAVLPLASWMGSLTEGRELRVFREPVDLSASGGLQWDGLHPTVTGQIALALLVLEELERIHGFAGAAIRSREPAAIRSSIGRVDPAPETNALPPPPV